MKFKLLTILILMSSILTARGLIISNAVPTNITTTSAYFRVSIISTNGTGTNPTMTVFYGKVDYTTNADSWASSNVYGTSTVATISTQITALTAMSKYYYSWRGVEGTATAWTVTSTNFWTKPSAPTSTPAVVSYSVTTDTNGVLKAPTNFFGTNIDLITAAGGLTNEPLWEAASGTVVYTDNDSVTNYTLRTLWYLTNGIFEGRIGTNESAITAQGNTNLIFEGRIGTNEGDVLTLQGRVGTNDGLIVTIDGRVGTNESGIAANLTNSLLLAGGNKMEADIDGGMFGYTNAIKVIAGDLTATNQAYVPKGLTDGSAVNREQLYDLLAAESALTLYGSTGLNSFGSSGSWITTPDANSTVITSEFSEVNETNYIGTYWTTNATDVIRASMYNGVFHADRFDGNGICYGYFDLVYTDDGGATTNLIATSSISGTIIDHTEYRVSAPNLNNIENGTNLFLGVDVYIVKVSGSQATDIRLYLGAAHPSRLETPGFGELDIGTRGATGVVENISITQSVYDTTARAFTLDTEHRLSQYNNDTPFLEASEWRDNALSDSNAVNLTNNAIWDGAVTDLNTLEGQYEATSNLVDGVIIRTNAWNAAATGAFAGAASTGLVTSAAGDAGNFLKADGTWATPPGSAESWSSFDATQLVDMARQTVTNADSVHVTNEFVAWNAPTNTALKMQALINMGVNIRTRASTSFNIGSEGGAFGGWISIQTNGVSSRSNDFIGFSPVPMGEAVTSPASFNNSMILVQKGVGGFAAPSVKLGIGGWPTAHSLDIYGNARIDGPLDVGVINVTNDLNYGGNSATGLLNVTASGAGTFGVLVATNLPYLEAYASSGEIYSNLTIATMQFHTVVTQFGGTWANNTTWTPGRIGRCRADANARLKFGSTVTGTLEMSIYRNHAPLITGDDYSSTENPRVYLGKTFWNAFATNIYEIILTAAMGETGTNRITQADTAITFSMQP